MSSTSVNNERRLSGASATDKWGILGPEECLRRERLEEANERKRQFLNVAIAKPTGYLSGKQFSNCPPGAEAILKSNELYVQPANITAFQKIFLMEMDHKYEIVDKDGAVLYYAAETLIDWNEFPSKAKSVDISVVGPKGGLVFDITGSLDKKDSFITVRNDNTDTEFGTIKKSSSNKFPFYSSGTLQIFNPAGDELFHLVPNKNEAKGSYSIHIKENKISNGKFKSYSLAELPSIASTNDPPQNPNTSNPLAMAEARRKSYAYGSGHKNPNLAKHAKPRSKSVAIPVTDPGNAFAAVEQASAIGMALEVEKKLKLESKTLPSPASAQRRSSLIESNHIYGIVYPAIEPLGEEEELDGNSKLLLLSAMILMNHLLYTPINYGPNRKQFWVGVIFNGVIAGIILGMIVLIIVLVLNQQTTMEKGKV